VPQKNYQVRDWTLSPPNLNYSNLGSTLEERGQGPLPDLIII